MGQGAAKGVVFVTKLGVAKWKGPKPDPSDNKTTRILKLRGAVDDVTTRICAALSSWVYTAERDLVTVRDATIINGRRANDGAAFRFSPDFKQKEDGFIPNGRVLPKIESGEWKQEGMDRGVKWVKLRFLGMAVYVKEKHTERCKSNAVLEDEGTAKEITALLEGQDLLPEGTTVTLARFRSNGPLLPSGVTVVLRHLHEGKPRFAVVVCWQGTQADQRPMDIFTDVCGVPVRAPLWYKEYPGLRVHNGMYGIMQDEFLLHREDLLKILRQIPAECGRRLVFTGHSLGGGIALLAHMASMLEVENPLHRNELKDLDRVEVCSIVFAAPMVFYIDPSVDPTEKKFADLRERFGNASLNYIFDKDIVPRLPGLPNFAVPAFKLAATTLVRELAAQKLAIAKDASCLEYVADLVRGGSSMFLESSTTTQTMDALRQFCHLSTLQHWTTNLEDPSDTPTITDGQNLGADYQQEEGEDYKYFLACHSWFPTNILEPRVDPK